jgi:hypothetical protein
LIREDLLLTACCCDGYTDLLGPGAPARRSPVQRALHSPTAAAINERAWRPIMVAVLRLHGLSLSAERDRAAAALHLGGNQRMLAPDGRIAVLTLYGREAFLMRKLLEFGAAICGVRVFDRTTVPAFFAAAGLIDIDQQLHGISQFVAARRPDKVAELDGSSSRSSPVRTQRQSAGQ